MAVSELGKKTLIEAGESNDSIVIVDIKADIPGGKTLDVSDVPAGTTHIKAGHVVIKTAEGEYKPLPIHEAAEAQGTEGKAGYVPAVSRGYDAVPEGCKVVGVTAYTCKVNDPRVGILIDCTINEAAAPCEYSAEVKAALPTLKLV